MSFPASSIPAFTAALKSGLEARAALRGVVIADGPATQDVVDSASDLFELLDVDGQEAVHSLNKTTQPRLEQLTLSVLITVVWTTSEQQTAVNERAFVLLDELNQLLRDSDAGVTSIYAGPGRIYGPRITHKKHTKRTNSTNTKREAGLEVGVYWEAKI